MPQKAFIGAWRLKGEWAEWLCPKDDMKVEICGVKFDGMDLDGAVRAALRPTGEACWVVTPNALMLESCRRHPEHLELLNAASMALPDGAGVMLAAKKRGTPLPCRVAGIDFGEALLAAAASRGDRVFLLGGADGVAPAAAQNLIKKHPSLCICGSYWGYFDKMGEENRRVIGLIRACRPDILLVGFGFPLQEIWIRENLSSLPSVRVVAGLGGALDVWAGRHTRAPLRWQKNGLEWAWRMVHEPKRVRDLPALLSFYRSL